MNLDIAQLAFSYDEEDDILYIDVGGRGSRDAITYETDEGHLVRVDPQTYELIGAEILSFQERWEGRDLTLSWDVPARSLWRRLLPDARSHAHREARVPASLTPAVR